MKKYDVVVLTEAQYIAPSEVTPYIQNVLDEDQMVIDACNSIGLRSIKKAWDDPDFSWASAKTVVFRTTWDYFHRFTEFSNWLSEVQEKTMLINSAHLIHWNIDKKYLGELAAKDVRIAPTLFIKKGEANPLKDLFKQFNYGKVILKPCVSGAARHTYKIDLSNIAEYEAVFAELIKEEDLMLQEFQETIAIRGEVSLVLFGGEYSHAVLKKAKVGDFRVQDDWGGSLHEYSPSKEEIEFAKHALKSCPELPVYARVDIMWNEKGEPLLAELELIEPELWFRRDSFAADKLAKAIQKKLESIV